MFKRPPRNNFNLASFITIIYYTEHYQFKLFVFFESH